MFNCDANVNCHADGTHLFVLFQVDHLDMARYVEMFKTAEFRDDLDIVSPIHTPRGNDNNDSLFLYSA